MEGFTFVDIAKRLLTARLSISRTIKTGTNITKWWGISLKNLLMENKRSETTINTTNTKMAKLDPNRSNISTHINTKNLKKTKNISKIATKWDSVSQISLIYLEKSKTEKERVQEVEKDPIALVSVMIRCCWMELQYKFRKMTKEEKEAMAYRIIKNLIAFHKLTFRKAGNFKSAVKNKILP